MDQDKPQPENETVPQHGHGPARRLAWLTAALGADLVTAFLADPRNAAQRALADAGGEGLLQRLRDTDPTPTGACTQWLARLMIAGRLPVEDLPKAHETLAAFIAYKRRLEPAARDLGRYDSLGVVWKAVEPFVMDNAPVSGKDEERRERAAARAESTVLVEGDGWTVAIPRTERAAKWWGRGTRWCTAADKDNAFEHYDKSGPLVVFVAPDGAKFQFHARTAQFMDAVDDEADCQEALGLRFFAHLTERLPGLAAAMYPERGGLQSLAAAVTEYGLAIEHLPESAFSPSLCMTVVQRDPRDLRQVPERMRDHDLCLAAVRKDGNVLCYVPSRHRDRDVCLAAVMQNGMALSSVPHRMRESDPEFSRRAVANTGWALQFVPKHMRDYDLCWAAVGDTGRALQFVPEVLQDWNLCVAAVRKAPEALHSVPKHLLRNLEICVTAVRARRDLRGLVPADLRERVDAEIAALKTAKTGDMPCLGDGTDEEAALPALP